MTCPENETSHGTLRWEEMPRSGLSVFCTASLALVLLPACRHEILDYIPPFFTLTLRHIMTTPAADTGTPVETSQDTSEEAEDLAWLRIGQGSGSETRVDLLTLDVNGGLVALTLYPVAPDGADDTSSADDSGTRVQLPVGAWTFADGAQVLMESGTAITGDGQLVIHYTDAEGRGVEVLYGQQVWQYAD